LTHSSTRGDDRSAMPDVLLLCRHMKRADEAAVAAAAQWDADSPDELAAVAERLRGALADDGLTVGLVLHARTSIATAHANWLAAQLTIDGRGPAVRSDKRLDPELAGFWSKSRRLDRFIRCVLDQFSGRRPGTGRAVLVIGHMPQLGWIAARLLGNRPRWRRLIDGSNPSLPLENAEVAAIVLEPDYNLRPSGRLDWTVAPDEAQAIDELREKIKSKMEVAKLLGGFMSLVLGGVLLAPGRLKELGDGDDTWAVAVAAVSFLVAIGLYLRTMYAYDTLLMPRRFWGESAPGSHRPRWLVRRPPSSAAWVLYQNMVHVWTFVFTPATVAVIVGLLALAYAAFEPTWAEGLGVGTLLLAVSVYALRRGPVLGSQD
jgi:hypothetical protein